MTQVDVINVAARLLIYPPGADRHMFLRILVVDDRGIVGAGSRIEHVSAPSVDGLDALSDAQVLDECRAIEQARRELDAREALVLAQVRSRGLASADGCASDEAFLRVLLNVGVREAAARMKLADALAPRRTVTGEPVPPAHPALAEALGAGEITARAAGTIVAAVARRRTAVR